ncbi:hypothetical protein AgCh_025621 [Apium graveolens]
MQSNNQTQRWLLKHCLSVLIQNQLIALRQLIYQEYSVHSVRKLYNKGKQHKRLPSKLLETMQRIDMCFMMDRGGDRLCYVQFPQRFEGIDPSDRVLSTLEHDASFEGLHSMDLIRLERKSTTLVAAAPALVAKSVPWCHINQLQIILLLKMDDLLGLLPFPESFFIWVFEVY